MNLHPDAALATVGDGTKCERRGCPSARLRRVVIDRHPYQTVWLCSRCAAELEEQLLVDRVRKLLHDEGPHTTRGLVRLLEAYGPATAAQVERAAKTLARKGESEALDELWAGTRPWAFRRTDPMSKHERLLRALNLCAGRQREAAAELGLTSRRVGQLCQEAAAEGLITKQPKNHHSDPAIWRLEPAALEVLKRPDDDDDDDDDVMPCGNDEEAVVSADEGTAHCSGCEAAAVAVRDSDDVGEAEGDDSQLVRALRTALDADEYKGPALLIESVVAMRRELDRLREEAFSDVDHAQFRDALLRDAHPDSDVLLAGIEAGPQLTRERAIELVSRLVRIGRHALAAHVATSALVATGSRR